MIGRIKEPTALSARLDAALHQFASRRRDVHHAVIAVTRGDGSFRWTAARGEAEPGGPPMGEDSPYFIASISKLYLAAVVLLLMERRRLALGDRISDHLPARLIAGLHRWQGIDRTSEITVRHLLSHTSGLADYYEGTPKRGLSLRVQLTTVGDADVIAEEALRIVREDVAPRFPPQPLDAPRQRAFYGDTNFLLLGLIVQSVTGDALGRVYEDLLFRPLELVHTYHYRRTQPLSPLSSGPATIWFKDRPLKLHRAMSSFLEDGVVSTANDTLKFLDALVHGRVFSDRATLDVMQGRWNRIFFPFEYALGTMRFRLPRIMTLRYLPALVGHAGSSGSWLFHCPELDLLLAGTLDQAASPSLPFKLLSKVLWLIQGATGR